MSASDLAWFKSSYSGSQGDSCVEVALTEQAICVRDSKDVHARISPSRVRSGRGSWGSWRGPERRLSRRSRAHGSRSQPDTRPAVSVGGLPDKLLDLVAEAPDLLQSCFACGA